jgi:DNA-binding transcriptional regulator YiaG
LTRVPCTCGGTMVPVKARRYDVSAELGIGVVLVGDVVGVECDRCKAFAIAGPVLESAAEMVVVKLLELERRVSGAEARFLRNAALGIGQAELAERLGVSRPTVARWEAARSLSAEHDFELRSVVVGEILTRARLGTAKVSRAEVVALAGYSLKEARRKAAPKRIPPLRLPAAA